MNNIEEELQKIDNMEENQGYNVSTIICKKYNNIEDLKRDNGNQELVYERIHTTRYIRKNLNLIEIY